MANPITWRNVNGPDFSGGNLISSGVSDIQSGLAGLQNILGTQARQQQETWQQTKEANTLNALNQVNQIGSVEQLDSTQASDLINPYGAQVNAQAVMDALKGQRGVIADDMQTEDSITSYTEKVKYGPIASQAALLIQQGRIQEAAPLLQELQGTSYAEKLGAMVQNTNWHNEEVGFKEQELALRRSQLAAENRRYTEAENEDRINNQAVTHLQTLISKGTPPNDALTQTLRVFGPKLGADTGKLIPTLTGFASAAYQLPTETQLAIDDAEAKVKTARAENGTLLANAKERAMQQVGFNPAMQEQINNYTLKPNSHVIGDGDGQIPKAEVDKLNSTLASQELSPLTVGEIAWLAQNPDSGSWGIGTEYKLGSIITQRKANNGYQEMISGLQNAHNAEDTKLVKELQAAVGSARRYAYAPNAHPEGAKAFEGVNTAITNSGVALTNTFGKVVDGPERERRKEEERKAAEKQNKVLVNQIGQLSEENARLNQNGAGHPSGQFPTSRAYSTSYSEAQGSYNAYLTKQAEERRINAPKKEWAANYTPKTSKDWDTVQQALTADIQQSDSYPTMKLRALNAAIEKAKNGDDRVFKAYFKDRLEKYAETIYPDQKAGKK